MTAHAMTPGARALTRCPVSTVAGLLIGAINGFYNDAKGYMQPYMQTGTMANTGIQSLLGGDYSGFYNSPDFKAAMQAGGDMLDNSAASRGGLFGGGDDKDADRIDSIDTVIASVSQDGSGRYRLRLEDDALWVQTDSIGTILPPRAGQKIHIKSAAMGSFMAKVEGGRAFRVRRER